MKKLILFIFLLTVGIATAQTGADNRTYTLKEIDEAPATEGVIFTDYFKKNFSAKEKPAEVQFSFVVEKGGVVRDIKVTFEVHPTMDRFFIYRILGGEIQPGAMNTAVFGADGSVTLQ